jgi:hypothetical protein
MSVNPLFSCRVKMDRAYQHFSDFQKAIEAFSGRNPNPVITDEDTEPGIKIDRFSVKENIPPEFSAYIGDIAHNLISALDSLATSLIKFADLEPITEEVMRDTYFPISWENGFTGARIERFLKRVGPDAEQIIRAMQPYKGGKMNDLFLLWRLNVIDKHRAIVPVAADLIGVEFTFPGNDGPPLPPREGARKPRFPLKSGDELSRRVFSEPEYDAHAHFRLQIVFGEGQVFEGKPVLPTLDEMIQLVEGIIYVFSNDIFEVTEW